MLEEARRLGFLGPGPIVAHLDHADGFGDVLMGRGRDAEPWSRAADLGSGGGVPGLALALRFPASRWLLVDSSARRTAFLRAATEALELGDRVTVAEVRAEELGRQAGVRSQFEVVVARGFGPPAVTAECAAPLLAVRGWAVVSEPPGGAADRWPVDGLGILGMTLGPAARPGGASFQVLIQREVCPARYPRRVGVPRKRPLF